MPKSRRRSIRDRFSRILTSGSIGGILILGVAVAILVGLGALTASLLHIHAGEHDLSLPDAIWEITQRAIDPGQLDGELAWSSRILLLSITGIGILLISTLISIVNSTLERRIESLRRGRGPVEATNHVVILGWNDTGLKVTEELAEAFIDDGAVEVVILCNADPIQVGSEIQEEILRRHPGWRSRRHIRRPDSWLTIRRGEATNIGDLASLARLSTAKSVIVLGENRSDAETTKVVLAIVASIQTTDIERKSPLNIIAALNDNELGRRLQKRIHQLSVESTVLGEPIAELIPVLPEFMRTGIEAQVVRHRGLSEVYRDLLDFDGDELYLVSVPPGAATFGDVVLTNGIVVLGVQWEHSIDLWPSWDLPIGGALLLVLAESRHSAIAALSHRRGTSLTGSRALGRPVGSHPESILIIGWNRFASDLLHLLCRTSPPESTFTVLAHEQDRVDRTWMAAIPQARLEVRSQTSDPLDDRAYIEAFDHVIVLSHEEMGAAESDAAVLADVLACRVSASTCVESRRQPTTVVAELRQRVSKNIAGVRLADDLLLSDSLNASAMAHLAIHPQMAPVLGALLGADSPDDAHLMSIELATEEFFGQTWANARKTLAQRYGELGIAIRTTGVIAQVIVNPPASRVIENGEEIVVFSRYLLDQSESPAVK